ncbi:MAG: fibrobacter succinogenes major paralogous domain-containing protein [Burkholderiales bacterium]|nr:fibrobacter succinogenes major paralogous domain-containing protein [Flavobacterium sp.]
MRKYYFTITSILFIVFGLSSCSNEDAKTQNQVASRPSVPITNSEVQIGIQIWMAKNLNVSRYRNGDIIPQVNNQTQWQTMTTGAWRYYEDVTANGLVYGKLYNWYAVSDPRGLAPQGWHIPSVTEWITLSTFLGGDAMAGGKMKATTLWNSPNLGASNISGFTGFPGGYFQGITFAYRGDFGFWWSTSAYNSSSAYNYCLGAAEESAFFTNNGKYFGCSARCIKN